MWDRAAACFHADKKPPDSCGRGSSGCGRTVLNFKRVRALPAWNASRMDGGSVLRMESEPQKRSSSRSAGRQPSNCGWEVDWLQSVLEKAEGKPLKNLTVGAADEAVSGELLITKYGLEGGAIYWLGPTLRRMKEPALTIDFKPQLSADVLRKRASNLKQPAEWFRAWKLNAAAVALMESSDELSDARVRTPRQGEAATDLEGAIEQVKDFFLRLQGPRPIDEAISSAGGVPWSELDETLMLRKAPGVFVAGEMIDWEAPTGGYLLQGCFATGTRAGASAAAAALNR